MSSLDDKWFRSHWDEGGIGISLKIEEILHREKSVYQDILIFKSQSFGNVLVLDDDVQCTEQDEYSYHEMMAHIPLSCHPNPQNVLVVGGGDGGVVREILKHPDVQHITVCEIDKRVIELCKKYLPNMANSLNHPKVEVIIDDGSKFIKKHTNKFDVIITDVPDLDVSGPTVAVYTNEYYENLKTALKETGLLCSQGGNLISTDIPLIKSIMNFCRNIFAHVEYAISMTPTYVGGHNGFILCSRNQETNFEEPLINLRNEDVEEMKLRYYNSKMHRASFCLPHSVHKELYPVDTKNMMNGVY